ncbi:MAG: hypothetical protein CME45_01670 [Halieaceae bacterium]|nr:hypothetical protein [Halieaceae bacterium]
MADPPLSDSAPSTKTAMTVAATMTVIIAAKILFNLPRSLLSDAPEVYQVFYQELGRRRMNISS